MTTARARRASPCLHACTAAGCSDDRHPDDLVLGHINDLVRRALRLGVDKMKVLRCACVNPVQHYGLEVGLLQEGCWADFIEIDSFDGFNVLRTFINGELLAEKGRTLLAGVTFSPVNIQQRPDCF